MSPSRFFEDFNIGDEFVSAGLTVTESAIVDFALTYDPQRFHIDREAAERSPYGSLIASGFQTLALAFRMFFNLGVIVDTGLGSPGIDELRWTLPVRPGDTIRTRVVVGKKRISKSRPDRGILEVFFTVLNQRGETVLTFTTPFFVARRT